MQLLAAAEVGRGGSSDALRLKESPILQYVDTNSLKYPLMGHHSQAHLIRCRTSTFFFRVGVCGLEEEEQGVGIIGQRCQNPSLW